MNIEGRTQGVFEVDLPPRTRSWIARSDGPNRHERRKHATLRRRAVKAFVTQIGKAIVAMGKVIQARYGK